MGHRGAMGYEVENTIASFERAIALRCDEVETDVWLQDGRLVIGHEPPTGRVALTLEDVLERCRGRVIVNVEVKAQRDATYARRAGAAVARCLAAQPADAYLSSFWWPALDGAREAAAAVGRAYIYSSYVEPDLLVSQARAHPLRALHPQHSYVTPELVAAAHAAGIAVNTWTANDPDTIAELVALGVDAIASDFPDRVPAVP